MNVRVPRLKSRIGGTEEEEEEEKQVWWCVLEASKDKVLVTKFLSALEREKKLLEFCEHFQEKLVASCYPISVTVCK